MTTNTSPHLTPPPSSLGHMNSERVGDEISPTPSPPIHRNPPSPRTQSKSILTVALQKAQTAVQFDAANNVVAALDAYKQTVELLSQVIVKSANEADRRRLQLIHDTYADRIRLLSTIAPESDSTSSNDTSGTEQDPELSECETNDKFLTSEQSMERKKVTESGAATTMKDDHRAELDVQGSTNDSDNDLTDVNSNQFSKGEPLNLNKNLLIHQNNDAEKIKQTENVEPTKVNGSMTNVIDHISTEDSLTSKRDDHTESTKSNRLSILSHKSNNSTSTEKSYTSKTPTSIYNGIKSMVDSNDTAEYAVSLDGSDSNTDSGENSDEKLEEKGKQMSNSNKDSPVLSSSSSQLEVETSLKNTTERRTLNSGHSRVFVPPPPPKIAPPNNNSHSHSYSDGTVDLLPPQHLDQPSLERSTLPSIVPPVSTSETTTALLSRSTPPDEDDDDKASVKSAPLESIVPAPEPQPSAPQNRRPAPLPLAQKNIYNSRNIPHTPSPSNTNLTGAVTPSSHHSHSPGFPKRSASNPGSSSRKSTVRFFNQTLSTTGHQSLYQIPGTPTSPWTSNLGSVPPPLGSPGFGPPTSGFRNDQSISPSKPTHSGYISCLMNPFPNTYDEDMGLPTKSNPALPEPPPSDVHLRPFWLMRLLERTMTTGGYLTPKLYIPCNLWQQGHKKLTAIDTKTSSCDVVLSCLIKLSRTSVDDMGVLAKELEGIEPILEGLQNSLARKLSYVESTHGKGRQSTSSLMNWGSKLSRSLDRMGMSNAMVRNEEANGYIDVLLKVFQNADIVEKYILYFSSLKPPHHHHYAPILTRLFKIADYFANVLCLFVVRDLGVLAD
ncbi:5739_t:CDS:2, partial [Acaulospora morrowiae]